MGMRTHSFRGCHPFVLWLVHAFAAATTASAQPACEPHWLPGDGVPGCEGLVRASLDWDPDGPGPATPVIVFAGSFPLAGNCQTNHIVRCDPNSKEWSSFGSGMNGSVRCLTSLLNGDLIAGGTFSKAGEVSAARIARWSEASSAWFPMGLGMNGDVLALITRSDGRVVAGGAFSKAGGNEINAIAQWDGSTWTTLGGGLISGSVMTLANLPNGDFVAGGGFPFANGKPVSGIARWSDVTGWNPLGKGVNGVSPAVAALAVQPNGHVIAGGYFTSAGGISANHIARWDGASWSPLGLGLNSSVLSLALLTDGHIIAGGEFTKAGSVNVARVARWDGGQWLALEQGLTRPTGQSAAHSLRVLASGDLLVTGHFDRADNIAAANVALRGSSGQWRALATGFDDYIFSLLTTKSGEVIAAGDFRNAGDASANRIARQDADGKWHAMGLGMSAPVRALAQDLDGGIIAGGDFGLADGTLCKYVARWDGQAWSPMAGGLNYFVTGLHAMANGDVIVGGAFTQAGDIPANRVARWDGSAWSALGAGVSAGNTTCVYGIAEFPSGDVVVVGDFSMAGSTMARRIARWNGAEWSALGGGLGVASLTGPPVRSVIAMPNGDVIAAGGFLTAGGVDVHHVARWNGSFWSPVGTEPLGVSALALLPDGGLVASGAFEGSPTNFAGIARWTPDLSGIGHWRELGRVAGSPWAMAVHPSADVVLGGELTLAGDDVSAWYARLSCPFLPCYPDCDGSQALDIEDFICFQTLHAVGDPSSDCNLDSLLTIDDFICFQTLFAIGC